MNWKLAIDVLVVLVLFAFGPRENRQFLFRSEPDALYGELVVFTSTDSSLALARNATASVAEFPEPKPRRIWWQNAASGAAVMEIGPQKMYTETLAIVERPTKSSRDSSALIQFGDAPPLRPRPLRVITEGEEFHDFIGMCIVVILVALLSFAICDYSWRCGSPLRDILEEVEKP